MKLFFLVLLFVPFKLITCDWEVINYEPETYIYYIIPMNESELVSYSYDGQGNMFYQYSSDNGSTWEVIREEKFIKFEHQPEQIVKVIRANDHTILFVRKVSQILAFDTKTRTWDSTFVQYAGSPLGQRDYYQMDDKIYIIMMDENEEKVYEPFLFEADNDNPLAITKAPLFDKEDPARFWFRIDYGMFDNELYFARYIDDTYFNKVYKYNVVTKVLDSISFQNDYEFVKFYKFGNNIYCTDVAPIEGNNQKSKNNGFYKYNPETKEAELLYKFDHNYYGEPYFMTISDNSYSLIINGVYYLFVDDVFIKKHLPLQLDCPECEANKKSLVHNKYNDYYYYTTDGFCLFRSADYMQDILSSVDAPQDSDNKFQRSIIVKNSKFEYELGNGEVFSSAELYNLNGQSVNAIYEVGAASTVTVTLPNAIPKGVYIMRIETNVGTHEIKLLKE